MRRSRAFEPTLMSGRPSGSRLVMAVAILSSVSFLGWCVQYFAAFAPRSRQAGLTGLAIVAGSAGAAVAVSLLCWRLVRVPESRTRAAVLVAALGVVAGFPALLMLVALATGR